MVSPKINGYYLTFNLEEIGHKDVLFLDKSTTYDNLPSMDVTHQKCLDTQLNHKGSQSLDKLLKEEERG